MMKCPHCLIMFHDKWSFVSLDKDKRGIWRTYFTLCPECGNFVINFKIGHHEGLASHPQFTRDVEIRAYPIGSSRPPCPPEVPKEFVEDYSEACLVLPFSPKASAALSRRCLQNILRDVAKVNPGNLYDEIQELLDRKTLPSHIADSIDEVRIIGNFAAHPMKSKATGEIVQVEPEEAEWNLDVLEFLFDYYFVTPAKVAKKKAKLKAKRKDATK